MVDDIINSENPVSLFLENHYEKIKDKIVKNPSIIDLFSIVYVKADYLLDDLFSYKTIIKTINLYDSNIIKSKPLRSIPEYSLLEQLFIKSTNKARDKYVPYDKSKKEIYINSMKDAILEEFRDNYLFYENRINKIKEFIKEADKLKGTLDFFIVASKLLKEYRCNIFKKN